MLINGKVGDPTRNRLSFQSIFILIQECDLSQTVYLKESEGLVAYQHTNVLIRILLVHLRVNLPVSEDLTNRLIESFMVAPPLLGHVVD